MNYNILKIKICGMKFIENILKVSTLQPDFMGFIFYKLSPRFIKNNFIIPNLKNIKKIGVFVESSKEEIKLKYKKYNLDYVQLHGRQNLKFCKKIINQGFKIIKVFNINKNFSFKEIKEYEYISDYFLFDTKSKYYGGSGEKFPWIKLSEYYLNTPFFLSGGITSEDAKEILSISHPKLFGIDINSGFENYPGYKNFQKLKYFIQIIRS